MYVIYLRREDGHVLRMALYFDVEGQRKNGGSTGDMEKAG